MLFNGDSHLVRNAGHVGNLVHRRDADRIQRAEVFDQRPAARRPDTLSVSRKLGHTRRAPPTTPAIPVDAQLSGRD